jgi:hypothetical protein
MAADANPAHDPPGTGPDDPADAARYAEVSTRLVDTVADVVPRWIERSVRERLQAWRGHVSPEVAAQAVAAGEAARDEVVPRLRSLVETDIDEQRTNPLALLRDATSHGHRVLAGAGMPSMPRDQFARSSFPDDDYGLVPATWADIDPDLHEIGITWGAAKAFLFKARRRAEGKE